MKFISLTIAAVGVAALPQTLQAPAVYAPCGTQPNYCCKTAGGKFTDCSALPGAVPTYHSYIQSCAPSSKIPACCTEKQSTFLVGVFNQILGTTLKEFECILPPPQL